jgi:molybdopterin adenylyltransferase
VFEVAILVLSDKGAKGDREDRTGAMLKESVKAFGWEVVYYEVLPDERDLLMERLISMCDYARVDLVLTSGGTGLAPRDITPEATLKVVDRQVPGLGEAMRAYGMQKTPRAMLSRGIAGIRKHTLIINLPGSIKGARESLEAVMGALEHGLDTLKGRATECGQE